MKEGAILTRGLDGCLFLYSIPEWNKLAKRMEELPLTGADARTFSRYLFSGGIEVGFDSLGRIVIPDYLARHASLNKKLIIIGVLNRVEIWSEKNWKVFNKNSSEKSVEVAEKLSGSGI